MCPENNKREEELFSERRGEVKEPPLYMVVLFNDDYTTKDFVIKILLSIFSKPLPEAIAITERVHRNGTGIIGAYPYDIATTKTNIASTEAKKSSFPLRFSIVQKSE